jgi:RNA-directed DNA polymerase
MVDAVVWTEGKTDAQYLRRAGEVLGFQHHFDFPVSVDMGDDQLFKQCVALSKASQSQPTIFIFDRDNPDVVSKVNDGERPYKSWGNNVFSFAIPVPDHRSGDSGVCIELYFNDRDLMISNVEGRRLFLSTEFNHASGRHLSETSLSVGHKGKLSPEKAKVKILDTEVYDVDHNNVALSKSPSGDFRPDCRVF